MTKNTAPYTDKEALRSALEVAAPNWGSIRKGETAFADAISNKKTKEQAFRAALDAATSNKDKQLDGERVLIAHGKLAISDDVESHRNPKEWVKEKFSNSSGLSYKLIGLTVLGGFVGWLVAAIVLYPLGEWTYSNLTGSTSPWGWLLFPSTTIVFAIIGYHVALRREDRGRKTLRKIHTPTA
jgi:hypothetical protein